MAKFKESRFIVDGTGAWFESQGRQAPSESWIEIARVCNGEVAQFGGYDPVIYGAGNITNGGVDSVRGTSARHTRLQPPSFYPGDRQ